MIFSLPVASRCFPLRSRCVPAASGFRSSRWAAWAPGAVRRPHGVVGQMRSVQQAQQHFENKTPVPAESDLTNSRNGCACSLVVYFRCESLLIDCKSLPVVSRCFSLLPAAFPLRSRCFSTSFVPLGRLGPRCRSSAPWCRWSNAPRLAGTARFRNKNACACRIGPDKFSKWLCMQSRSLFYESVALRAPCKHFAQSTH